MKKQAKTSQNKAAYNTAQLSFKRKLLLYYLRFVLFCKISVLILVILLFTTSIFDQWKKRARAWSDEYLAGYGFILKEITIESQQNTPSNKLHEVIKLKYGTPIFAISPDEVKQQLEGTMWIKKAIVERQLPSNLHIAIAERVPVAIWQFQEKLYLIDEDGNRLSNYEGNEFDKLLHVVGADANIYAQNLIEELNKYPSLYKQVVAAVRYGQRRWNLHLKENITVKMPENDFANAYRYLNELYEQNKLLGQGYKTLDLRSSEKYFFEKHN
jgi:cell division protein FtsQ